MQDTYLLYRISQTVKGICEDDKIKRIDEITLVVSHKSHVNEESLREYLELHNNNVLSEELQIIIQREGIEDQMAIIRSLQGERFDI